MKHPLTAAITLSLSLLAGCAAPPEPIGRSQAKPDAELDAPRQLAEAQANERDDAAGADVRLRATTPQPAEPKIEATSKQALADSVAQIAGAPPPPASGIAPSVAPMPASVALPTPQALPPVYREIAERERYAELAPNRVQLTAEHPVSTFSIDVDTGSLSNVRRMLEQGSLPPANAVRTEEFINWFDYGYAPPASLDTPFSVTTELATTPWNTDRQLLLIGLKGYEVDPAAVPASNLVFLVDTSGSMQSEDKLGLLKQSLRELAQRLRPQDRVSIVAYAGSAGVVLEPTAGDNQDAILAALDRLEAGGSTAGAAGIELAYQVAQAQFVKGGVNRVILATDGDFNVGTVSIEALEAMIRERRRGGVALTTLGFGRDNYNDELAERLADLGNGNHAYIDSLAEGRKVLVDELSSTLLTIASDVKIQIEFNPAVVAEYRLLGYENRSLQREDFNNDQVDAGEIGAGHDVTALYELTLVDARGRQVSPLRYAQAQPALGNGSELAFLKLRYKPEHGAASQLIERPITRQASEAPSARMQLASTVAAFAERLRGSAGINDFDYEQLLAQVERMPAAIDTEQRAALGAMLLRAQQLSVAVTPATLSP